MSILSFIKSGYTTDKGELDDARIAAILLVLTYVAMGLYGIHKVESRDIAAFVQSWAIGAAALTGGIGAWFGLRKDN